MIVPCHVCHLPLNTEVAHTYHDPICQGSLDVDAECAEIPGECGADCHPGCCPTCNP